jgi:hypothetical protein
MLMMMMMMMMMMMVKNIKESTVLNLCISHNYLTAVVQTVYGELQRGSTLMRQQC